MQPSSPLSSPDGLTSPAPKNLKKGALFLFVVVVVLAAIVALLMPKKQVAGQNAPTPTQHQAASPAFDHPTH
jgi:hypothetical protein